MCYNCNESQRTFGELVALPPVVPVESGDLDGSPCHSCEQSFDNRYLQTSSAGYSYCEECYDDTFFHCDNCSDECNVDDCHTGQVAESNYSRRRGQTTSYGPLCESCFDRSFGTCDDCSETFARENLCEVHGSDYCDECRCDRFTSCEECSEDIEQNEAHYVNDTCYCSSCKPASNCEAKRFSASSVYDRIGSRRTFGIELETAKCDDYCDLDGVTYFSACEDGSITGMEFVSRVLASDKGLDAIDQFCDEAEDRGFTIDATCGFHAHFGVGELTAKQKVAVLTAYKLTEKVWQAFVSRTRRNNTYCLPVSWNLATLAEIDSDHDFSWFVSNVNSRYQWLNVKAFSEHSTFEVRLHSATLDGRKVGNWVKAHARFIDLAATFSPAALRKLFDGKTGQQIFKIMADWWHDAELTEFYANRAEKFGTQLAAVATV